MDPPCCKNSSANMVLCSSEVSVEENHCRHDEGFIRACKTSTTFISQIFNFTMNLNGDADQNAFTICL